jgi:hypothetical protein
MIVICVLAGGIAIAARQQQPPARATDSLPSVLSADSAVPASTPMARPSGVRASVAPGPAALPDAVHASATHSAITVTGCLERADGRFRLKDTSGDAAPRARSWKSGFLKKGGAAIDIVDPAHQLSLGNQVGRRVSVTGTLTDREMRADSLRRVAASCKAS